MKALYLIAVLFAALNSIAQVSAETPQNLSAGVPQYDFPVQDRSVPQIYPTNSRSSLYEIDLEGATAIPISPAGNKKTKPKKDFTKPLFETDVENHYWEKTPEKSSLEEYRHYSNDISTPVNGTKPKASLWQLNNEPKPSFKTYDTDINKHYDRQSDGTYKLKSSSDNTGIYWVVALVFIGVIGFIFKSTQNAGRVEKEGGVIHKYAVLINCIVSLDDGLKATYINSTTVKMFSTSDGLNTSVEIKHRLTTVFITLNVLDSFGKNHNFNWSFKEETNQLAMFDTIERTLEQYSFTNPNSYL